MCRYILCLQVNHRHANKVRKHAFRQVEMPQEGMPIDIELAGQGRINVGSLKIFYYTTFSVPTVILKIIHKNLEYL